VPLATWVAAIRLWFCFGDELYPQYLQETLGISTRKTAKTVLEQVREVMVCEENRELFSAQNGAPNYSRQAGFTAAWRKEHRERERKRLKL
jgi:hypothetical protein